MSADALPSTSEGSVLGILSRSVRPRSAGPVSSSVTLGWRALLKINTCRSSCSTSPRSRS